MRFRASWAGKLAYHVSRLCEAERIQAVRRMIEDSRTADSPRCECGVFGIYGSNAEAARTTFFGLFALQHRGQESAGIVVSDGTRLHCHKGMGLASQVFDEPTLSGLPGSLAIGHNRYSTTGSSNLANAQPVLAEHPEGTIALGHNGNLVNAVPLRRELEAAGVQFEGTADSEIIAKLIAHYADLPVEEGLCRAMTRMEGAYSLVVLTPQKLIAARDPFGVRPLCLGQLDGAYIIASETCALHVLGAQFAREIEPGEVVIITEQGVESRQAIQSSERALCLFEFVYLARPDSHICGKSVHRARRRMGNLLAQEHPVDADLVIPVPDSGTPAAIGFAEASRIPFGEGLIKNRYVHRTFIQPEQRMRERSVRTKLTPLREALAGQRVVVVEDSIVRGTTLRNIIGVLREAGAREVHARVSSPPYRCPCFYGIDTATHQELIAARMTVEETRDFVGADSLGHLSLARLVKAVGLPRNYFCRACFDSRYPIPVPTDVKMSKFSMEEEENP